MAIIKGYPRKTRHPLEHKKSLILHHPPLLRPVSQKKSARDKRFAPLSKGESADHASKAEHKGRKRASPAAFHECRAVSRLRLRRVSSGEWPEGKEKNRGGLGKASFKTHASKCRVFDASF